MACDCISGDRSQSQREATIRNFKSGKINVVIATDVAARGLDIKGIQRVINYELPQEDFQVGREWPVGIGHWAVGIGLAAGAQPRLPRRRASGGGAQGRARGGGAKAAAAAEQLSSSPRLSRPHTQTAGCSSRAPSSSFPSSLFLLPGSL